MEPKIAPLREYWIVRSPTLGYLGDGTDRYRWSTGRATATQFQYRRRARAIAPQPAPDARVVRVRVYPVGNGPDAKALRDCMHSRQRIEAQLTKLQARVRVLEAERERERAVVVAAKRLEATWGVKLTRGEAQRALTGLFAAIRALEGK